MFGGPLLSGSVKRRLQVAGGCCAMGGGAIVVKVASPQIPSRFRSPFLSQSVSALRMQSA